MSNVPLNVNDSPVSAPPTDNVNTFSGDPAALPGLDLLEPEHASVLNETNDVPTGLPIQGDVKNDLATSLQSEAQSMTMPDTDTVMINAPVSNTQEMVDIEGQIFELDNIKDNSVAVHQQQKDDIIMDVQTESAHTIVEQPTSTDSINPTEQQPELNQTVVSSEEVAVASILAQPTDELAQSEEPTMAVISEKNEEQHTAILTESTEILPEEPVTVTDSKKTDEEPVTVTDSTKMEQEVVADQEQQPSIPSKEDSEISGLDAIDRALNNEPMHYSSDEEITTGKPEADAANDNKSDSESSDSSSSSSDSDSDSDEEENPRKRGNNELEDEELSDDNDDTSEGPVKSAHEILDEPAPKLPDNLKITPQTQLEHVGEIFRVTGKTVVIKASVSGEFRVLDEHSVFCTSDRVPFGVLYETFGRVQAPFYSVKFESEEEAAAFKPRCGEKVFYVVSASKFLFTDRIKAVKGSDASNFHDEEVPEEEQEFSDDEKERVAGSMKKTKKKKKKTKHDDTDRVKNTESTGDTPAPASGNPSTGSSNSNNRVARPSRGKPARGRGGLQSHPYQPHTNNNGNSNNGFNHPMNYQNSYNNQPYNNHSGGSNFGPQMNQQYNMGFNPAVPGMPYYNPQNNMFNHQQQQQYNPQQPYFNNQHQPQQQQHQQQQHQQQQQQHQQQQQQQQFYNPLQQHQFQMMQQIMMNFNNNPVGGQAPAPPMAQNQQGPPHFPHQQQQSQQPPQGPPGRQAPPRSYDTDLNYGGGSK